LIGGEEKIFNAAIWMSEWQREQYYQYGDVVWFDTTFSTNKFRFPLGAFCGMNNEGNTVCFALCLLPNETTESFKWAFEHFLLSVRKGPTLIFTDEDAAINAAIIATFPDSTHKLCSWHLERNLKPKCSGLDAATYRLIKGKFWELVKIDKGERSFVEQLDQMTLWCGNNDRAKEGIHHLRIIKLKWGKCFLKNIFHFDKSSTSRVESINSLIKRNIYKYEDDLAL
jgi:hypothetical protein